MNIIEVKDLNLWYGANQALKDVNISICANQVTALIGPSGCGKSTFLRTDLISWFKMKWNIRRKNMTLNNRNLILIEENILDTSGLKYKEAETCNDKYRIL